MNPKPTKVYIYIKEIAMFILYFLLIVFLVSYTLQATTYPFMALIALQTSVGTATPKMAVIERMEGTSHPEELISQIEIAIDRHGAVVNRLKNERSQRDMERQLLKDQDAAYHQSLKADQEKVKRHKSPLYLVHTKKKIDFCVVD